jgi:tRNA G18 (ribose-2'-O)-methylase SpoU
MKNTQLDHQQHQVGSVANPLCYLAHNIEDPTNVGSLFRIADAFGVEKIYLSGSSLVPPNSKIRKTSRSTEKYVSFAFEKTPLALLKKLKAEDYTIISLEITSSSTDIKDLKISAGEKICLILGSENSGVNQEMLDASDKTVHIPMCGHNSSMNVAMACSIVTYEITHQFRK